MNKTPACWYNLLYYSNIYNFVFVVLCIIMSSPRALKKRIWYPWNMSALKVVKITMLCNFIIVLCASWYLKSTTLPKLNKYVLCVLNQMLVRFFFVVDIFCEFWSYQATFLRCKPENTQILKCCILYLGPISSDIWTN